MNEWQPIETAPKEGKFLVAGGTWMGDVSANHPNEITIVERDFELFSECGGDFYSSCIKEPTHWMPLPAPPTI